MPRSIDLAVGLFASLLALTIAAPAPHAEGLDRGEAKVRADRLEVDHEARRALFTGHVHATYLGLTMECERLEVRYTESGEVLALNAAGRVVVSREGARATAKAARLDAPRGELVLTGAPTLAQGANRLEGARIVIHLSSERLEVQQAQGTFRLGAGS
jgi:lipopolysaccharide transport protein LptA